MTTEVVNAWLLQLNGFSVGIKVMQTACLCQHCLLNKHSYLQICGLRHRLPWATLDDTQNLALVGTDSASLATMYHKRMLGFDLRRN